MKKFDDIKDDDDRQKLIQAWSKWEQTLEYHDLMAYYHLNLDICDNQNPIELKPLVDDSGPNPIEEYFGTDYGRYL